MRRPRRRDSKRGFTLVELGVVLAILVLAAALLVPACQRTREDARRARCAENLRQIAAACLSYEGRHGCFPMGRNLQLYRDPPGPLHPTGHLAYHVGWSLHAALLPYIGRADLFNAVNFDWGPYQVVNATIPGALLPALWCPSDARIVDMSNSIEKAGWDETTIRVGYSSYGGMMGSFAFGGRYVQSIADRPGHLAAQDGMFPEVGLPIELGGFGARQAVRVRDVADGVGQTLLLGERAQGKLSKYNCSPLGHCNFMGRGWWASSDYGDASMTAFFPPNFTERDVYGTHAAADPGSPTARCDSADPFTVSSSSFHPGGANFAFADGSVRFVLDAVGSWDPLAAARSLDESCIPGTSVAPGVFQSLATRDGDNDVSNIEY